MLNLFGVPVPAGAVRVSIRPVMGRGPTLPLWEGRLSAGEELSDGEILAAAARNQGFWDYVDAQIRAKRIEPAEVFDWKLRLVFADQNATESSATTADTFEVFRGAALAQGKAADPFAQLLTLHQAGLEVIKAAASACTAAVTAVQSAASAALADVARAGAGAVAEASKAGAAALAEASKQTSEVSKLAEKLLEETSELKNSIFELQTERAKGAGSAPKSTTQELKELADTAKAGLSLFDGFLNSGGPEPPKTSGSDS